jgi:threonylcarbamoyladenosine tRNA methylthiotransferase MtaB
VILSGINLGEYRAPTGERFVDVLNMIASMDTSMRFRISSIEPNLLTDEIIRTVANSNIICPHFHLPLQSGSDEILRKMRRRYSAGHFADRIYMIMEKIPDCAIGVDVITGFPGESDELFRETYDLLESLPVSYLHVFTYSERKGTPAAKMKPVIPGNIRKERTKELLGLSERKTAEYHLRQLGRNLAMLPERINSETGLWTGWTENYVRTAVNTENISPNTLVKVRITETGEKLCKGEIIDMF